MLGCVYYNPSIPGSTLSQNNYENRSSISTEVVDNLYNGELPHGTDKFKVAANSIGESKTKLEDYLNSIEH